MKKILLLLCLIVGFAWSLTAANTFTDDLTPANLSFDITTTTVQKEVTTVNGTVYTVRARCAALQGNNQLQMLKTVGNYGGILITKTAGKLLAVSVNHSMKNAKMGLYLYGSDTPYTTLEDLYNASEEARGKLCAELVNPGAAGLEHYVLETPGEYKYYALMVPASLASAMFFDIHFEWESEGETVCAPIMLSHSDGTEIAFNTINASDPVELLVSCATEGAAISYEFNGKSGTIEDGKLTIDRSGTLKLTAAKDGFEPSERTLEVTLQLKAPVLTIGGAVYERDYLRAYASTTVALSALNDGAAISWEYNGKTGSSASVDVREDGELKVTLSKDGWTSSVRTLEVRGLDPLTSIQAVWNAYPVYGTGFELIDEEPLTVLFDATVVYVANVVPMASDTDKLPDGQIYITDGTHFSRIYLKDKSSDLKPGDVIAAGWTAHFRSQGGWKDFLPDETLTVKSHDGVVPAPVAVGSEEALQALDPGTPVMVSKVTLNTATDPDVYTGNINYIAAEGCGVNLVNAFGLASVEPGVYDVYGIVDFYGYKRSNAPATGPTDGDYASRNWRVAPTRWEEWLPTAPRPRFELSTGAEVDSGEPIVITCQDAEATIMYRFDEEEYAVYNPENKPVMPARDVTVSAYAVKEGNHDSAVRTVSLKYSGKAGIEAISADGAGEARYYDLQGRPVTKPATGLYIKVAGGKAGKVAL